MNEITITIQPGSRTVRAQSGLRALDAARRAGLPPVADCGGQGACGKCRVVFTQGAPAPTETDREYLSIPEIESGMRLACRAVLLADACFTIPPESRPGAASMSKEKSAMAPDVDPEPEIIATAVQLVPPSAQDARSDAHRLLDSLPHDIQAPPLAVLRRLPSVLRENGFNVRVIHDQTQILDIRAPETDTHVLGVALDIGTTTMALHMIDLEIGNILATALCPNPQTAYGADVISRIHYSQENTLGLATLQESVVNAANELLSAALSQSAAPRDSIYEILLVGNPAMVQIFLGVDPRPIASVPFPPALNILYRMRAIDAGLNANPGAALITLPCVAGYVGADAVGALLAANPQPEDLPALILDFGTNAEMILVCEDAIYACAAAAGPALEGAHLSCGMGAWPGAIDRVDVLHDGVSFTTVNDADPAGLCGTGALDTLAGLLNTGVIQPSGRFAPSHDWPHALQPHYAEDAAGRPGFAVARAGAPDAVFLSQGDVRQLQLARGAIAAGTRILLNHAGITPGQLKAVLPAGALGSFLRPETALRTGLVPETPPERIRFLGNAALNGAGRALINTSERKRASKLSQSIRYIELSGRSDFNEAFEQSLIFL